MPRRPVPVPLVLVGGLALTAALPGCAFDDAEVAEATAALAGGCKPWGCGDNSPVLDNHGFHELHHAGLARPNPDGLYLHAFRKGGVPYQIDLVGPRLVGRNADGAIVLEKAALAGAILEVRSVRDPALWYDLEIKQVSTAGATYWQGPATSLETYRIEYGGHGQARRTPLCDNPVLDTVGQQQGVPMNVHDVALFGSERYDAAGKRVSARGVAADGWINFGCAGGALAKLLLNRHVPVAHAPGLETTWQARQAMLKMFAADYCGTGASFTRAGEPLAWRDAAGWVPVFPLAVASHEAWWTEHGALCVEVPRLDVSDETYGPGLLEEDVAKACGGEPLPLCSTLPFWPTQLGDARFISANPTGS